MSKLNYNIGYNIGSKVGYNIESNMIKMFDKFIIYTDGACINNGKKNAKCSIGIHFSNKNKYKSPRNEYNSHKKTHIIHIKMHIILIKTRKNHLERLEFT